MDFAFCHIQFQQRLIPYLSAVYIYIYYIYIVFIMEKAMAPPSSTLTWKIPWSEEPGRLQSMGLLRVRHY